MLSLATQNSIPYQPKKNNFIVKQYIDHHEVVDDNNQPTGVLSHPVTLDHYKFHRNQRVMSDNIKKQVEDMWTTKSKPALILQQINQEHNTKFLIKDIYNLLQKLSDDKFEPSIQSNIEKLQAFIQKRREIDGHDGFNFTFV